jgi:uncharacterized integral membrane protein
MNMRTKTVPLVVLVVGTLIVLALAFTNGNMATVSLFGTGITVPQGAVLGGAYVLGMLLTLPLLFSRIATEAASSQRLTEWQQQDNKLALQVQSDREKQLEAKVATLETALQKALQRKS